MCFPSLFIQTIIEVYRSKSKAHNLFFPVFIYKVLRFFGLDSFPFLELVHIADPIGAAFLKQQQAQMKSAKPSTEISKRPRGEAFIATPTSGDQPAAQEILVDPATDDTVDPIAAPPLSLYAMMETFMTTQATNGQLIDELLTEVDVLRANFAEYRSAFPPPPLSNP